MENLKEIWRNIWAVGLRKIPGLPARGGDLTRTRTQFLRWPQYRKGRRVSRQKKSVLSYLVETSLVTRLFEFEQIFPSCLCRFSFIWPSWIPRYPYYWAGYAVTTKENFISPNDRTRYVRTSSYSHHVHCLLTCSDGKNSTRRRQKVRFGSQRTAVDEHKVPPVDPTYSDSAYYYKFSDSIAHKNKTFLPLCIAQFIIIIYYYWCIYIFVKCVNTRWKHIARRKWIWTFQ